MGRTMWFERLFPATTLAQVVGFAAPDPARPAFPHEPTARGRHARMLAHAAARRRAAAASLRNDSRVDALYWKACAPDAVSRARRLREAGLAGLP